MIENKIEIIIPTYNRAKYLDKTLGYLLSSPFKDCKITIRDNASSDDTPKICEKYSKLFKNLYLIKNRKNIGGNANIWRSYEEATLPYVWVLADNDYLNFDECDDLIEAIESEKYDLIICSSHLYIDETNINPHDKSISEYLKYEKKGSNIFENYSQDLAMIIKNQYIITASFMPSTIYKTDLIDTNTLMQGYDYVSRIYPHYALIAKGLNENLLTYKTKMDIVYVVPNPDEWPVSGLGWFVRYIDCIALIENDKIQNFALETEKGSLIYCIPYYILSAKIFNDETLKENTINLIKSLYQIKGWSKGLIYQIYIMICYFFPKKLLEILIKIKQKI